MKKVKKQKLFWVDTIRKSKDTIGNKREHLIKRVKEK